MDPSLAAAIVVTVGTLALGIITLFVNSRNSKTKDAIVASGADQAARIEEWDRLLRNCREDTDRVRREADSLRRELNFYRENCDPKDDE